MGEVFNSFRVIQDEVTRRILKLEGQMAHTKAEVERLARLYEIKASCLRDSTFLGETLSQETCDVNLLHDSGRHKERE